MFYKLAGVRAFYLGRVLDPNNKEFLFKSKSKGFNLHYAFAFPQKEFHEYTYDDACNLAQAYEITLNNAFEIAKPLSVTCKLGTFIISDNRYTPAFASDPVHLLDLAIALSQDIPELQCSLQTLRNQLPYLEDNWETQKQWWTANGQAWIEQLRAVTIEHRSIEHNWQFSDTEKQQLQQYYDANKLLGDCLNSDCYVSLEIRQEIEDTLLLPMSEIEKRQQGSGVVRLK